MPAVIAAMARTVWEAFNVSLSSTMQRGGSGAERNAGHLPTPAIGTASAALQSRQVSPAMGLSSKIWAGARTCPERSVHKSRELLWSCFVLQSWFDAGVMGFSKVWSWGTP